MTREEAINLVKQVLPCLNIDEKIQEGFETLIPELHESKDERIRKALIEVFKKKLERGFEWVEYGIPNRSVLDWLEKQKEQKPLSTEETELNSIAFLEQMGYTCIPPGKEQKPAEWCEKDKRMMRLTLETLEYISCQSKCEVVSWLKDLSNRFAIQPKQEWSEEDKKFFDNALSGLKYTYEDLINHKSFDSAEDVKNAFDWLKSLPERLNLQPKQEWSEENEKIMESLISLIETISEYYISDETRNGYITWLKSLCLQLKCECSKTKINGEPIPTENQSVDIPLTKWSEDDEKMIDRICADLEHFRDETVVTVSMKTIIDSRIKWLQNLKYLCPQPKQEWSEEDKEAYDMCYDAIPKAWKTKSGKLLTEWLKDKLKSLQKRIKE